MLITYNPTVGAETRNYRQEIRRALRPMGAGIVLKVNPKLPKGSVVFHLDRERWDTPVILKEVTRYLTRHFLMQQDVTIA